MIAPTASPIARPPVFVVIAKSSFVSKVPWERSCPANSVPDMVTKMSNAAASDVHLHQLRTNRGGILTGADFRRPVCAAAVNTMLTPGRIIHSEREALRGSEAGAKA
ncbi:hypothetical protein [Devosia sp.]|uniref:hypothetical protein n=1 Tax=Devosia sp. TaxID=1871048 RepID=UPI002AFF212E|nr:hypothetical protein [Devosia sp.]